MRIEAQPEALERAGGEPAAATCARRWAAWSLPWRRARAGGRAPCDACRRRGRGAARSPCSMTKPATATTTASALQKSIRGSDPDAAVHYLARILEAGDLLSACRRLLVIAAEDEGLAYPQAIPIVKACVDSAAAGPAGSARLPLADAARADGNRAQKQSRRTKRYSGRGTGPAPGQNRPGAPPAAEQAFRRRGRGEKGQNYPYPHDHPGHWVKQQYLPDALAGVRYYEYRTKQKRAGREGLLGQNQEVRARQAGAEAGRTLPAPAARAAGGRREQAR